jgi:rhodanese-related sulfurtransferase
MNSDSLPSVDADAAATADCVLLDVREHDEWMRGHAPTAIQIPMSEIIGRVDELDRTSRVICICRSGSRSARVTAWLRQQGFDAVNMNGGMHAWAKSGHPMVDHAGNPGLVI